MTGGIREAYVVATENDACNGVAMLFGHLLTNRAQIFSDVRTYWSPEAVKRVTGKELTGRAANGIIHLINSGATTLDGTGQQTNEQGEPVMKPYWDITEAEVEKCLEATTWYPANRDYFRGGGFSSNFLSKGGMPVTMMRLNLVKGLGRFCRLQKDGPLRLIRKFINCWTNVQIVPGPLPGLYPVFATNRLSEMYILS